ncbi:MAG: hypothetical protein QM751_08940 [Paludibacteraceae bacterium]
MKKIKKISFIFLFAISLTTLTKAQENNVVPDAQRTLELEVSKQTERLQMELSLSSEQIKTVYQINLKYAQARQKIVNRNEALQVLKNKDEEIRRVLTNEQYEQLEYKRTFRQPVEIGNNTQYLRTNPELRSNFRSRSDNYVPVRNNGGTSQSSTRENVQSQHSDYRIRESSRSQGTTRQPQYTRSTENNQSQRSSSAERSGSSTERGASSNRSTEQNSNSNRSSSGGRR